MARRIESYLLEGPTGPLEALLEEPEEQAPRAAALVCHPHPLYGGTMHNKVVYRLAKAMRRWGAVVLRFNFRGVGRSGGEHAHGRGEVEDAQSALSWLRARYPALPYTLAGFSFGSRVCLELGCRNLATDPPCRILVAGFPTRLGGTAYLERCAIPKIFVQSTRDEHGPRPELEQLFAGFAEPKRLVWVEASDHFFTGGLQHLEEEVFGLGAC